MPTTGPNLGITIADTPGTTPWYAWNETNLGLFDACIYLDVIQRNLDTPPGSPSDGNRYHIGATPTGAWAGQAGKIAVRRSSTWVFYLPKEGWLMTSQADSGKLYKYQSSAFVEVSASLQLTDFKDSVRVASAAAGTLASSFENGDTIDGVVLVTGNRILIKDQATASENGIYTVNASGAPTRATDFDTSAEVTAGCIIPVAEGTANADKLFILTTNDPITLGSTSLTFSVYGAAGAPALTATYVGYGDGSGLLTGSANITWNESTKTLTIANAAGTGFIDLKGAGSEGALRLQSGDHPGNGGGVIFPFIGGSQSSGPGIWWSDNTYANTMGVWVSLGFNFQGYASGPSVKIRKSTGTSSDGAVMFTLNPDSEEFTLADSVDIVMGTTTGTKIGTGTTQKIGFFNSTPIVQPTVTGSRATGAALADLLTKLASLGLIVDGTSA